MFPFQDSCTNGLYHKIYNTYWYCNTIIWSIIHYLLFAMQGKFSWCAALWFLGYYFYVLGTYVYYSLRQQKNFLCVVLYSSHFSTSWHDSSAYNWQGCSLSEIPVIHLFIQVTYPDKVCVTTLHVRLLKSLKIEVSWARFTCNSTWLAFVLYSRTVTTRRKREKNLKTTCRSDVILVLCSSNAVGRFPIEGFVLLI